MIGAVAVEENNLGQQDHAVQFNGHKVVNSFRVGCKQIWCGVSFLKQFLKESVCHIQAHHIGKDKACDKQAHRYDAEEKIERLALDFGFQALEVDCGRRNEKWRHKPQHNDADSRTGVHLAHDIIGKTNAQDYKQQGQQRRECLNPGRNEAMHNDPGKANHRRGHEYG